MLFYLKKVKNDLFSISKRLKKIEKNYQTLFNVQKKRYEIWFGGHLSFVAGKHLDERTLKKARTTHVRNAKKIFEDIASTNQKLEQKERRELEQRNLNLLKNFVDFASKQGKDVSFDDANTTKWL